MVETSNPELERVDNQKCYNHCHYPKGDIPDFESNQSDLVRFVDTEARITFSAIGKRLVFWVFGGFTCQNALV